MLAAITVDTWCGTNKHGTFRFGAILPDKLWENLTKELTWANVGFSTLSRSTAIRFSAVLSSTTCTWPNSCELADEWSSIRMLDSSNLPHSLHLA